MTYDLCLRCLFVTWHELHTSWCRPRHLRSQVPSLDSCDAMHDVAAQQGHHKQQSLAATHEQLWFPLLRWKVDIHLVLCHC